MKRNESMRFRIRDVFENIISSSSYEETIQQCISGGSQDELVEAVYDSYNDTYGDDVSKRDIECVVAIEIQKRGGPVAESCVRCGSDLEKDTDLVIAETVVSMECVDCGLVNDSWRPSEY